VLLYALVFAARNAGNLAERALLAPDTAASAALGLSWTAFCLLYGFTTNVVNACQFVVGRCTGEGDGSGARAAAAQALLLADGGGAVGLLLAVAAGAAAACAGGPARHAALFLMAQGLALGPLLGAGALTGYFAGTMRVGPRLLAAVGVAPVVIHLALAWLLTGLLPWSVAGAGLARLGAAVAAVAAALTVARGELVGLFVFDFAINFLPALLEAAKEQAYLLKATAAAAAGFGLLLALPPRPDGARLMGTFITAQAVWAVLLLIRVAGRWPGAAVKSCPAVPCPWCPGVAARAALSGTGAGHSGRATAPLPPSPGGMRRAREAPGDRKVESAGAADRLPKRAGGQGRGDARGMGAGSRCLVPGLIVMPKSRHTGGTCDGPPAAKHGPAAPGLASTCAQPFD
jgi:hypothetical protein